MSSDLNNFKNEVKDFSDELKKTNSSDLFNAFENTINSQIENLKEGDNEQLEILKDKLNQLKKIKQYYDSYKSDFITRKTKDKLSSIFDEVDYNDNFKEELYSLNKAFEEEKDLLNDSKLFSNSFYENIEENIDFTGFSLASRAFGSKEIDDFLKSFTVEYINTLNINGNISKVENIKEKGIFLTTDELQNTIQRSLLNTKNYRGSIRVNLYNSESVKINFSDFENNIPIPDKKAVYNYKPSFDNNNTIEEEQLSYGFSKYHYDKVLKKYPDEIEKLFILIRDKEINVGNLNLDNVYSLKDLHEAIVLFQNEYMEDLEDKYKGYFGDKTSKMINDIFSMKFELNESYDEYLDSYNKIIKLIPELKIDGNLTFIKLKKVLLNYQIKKAIIKNNDSIGAGLLGPRTKEDIKLSYDYYNLKYKELIDSGNISKQLFNEENNENFLLTSFLEEQKNNDGLYILPEGNSDFILSIINNKLKDSKTGKIYLNGVKEMNEYIFNNKTIKQNKDVFIHNFSVLMQFFADIESYGGKKFIKNGKSSAKGIFQFLDFNFYGEKNSGQSSWETAIQRNKNLHNNINKKTSKSFDFIYKNKENISPLSISTESLINIFISNVYYGSVSKGMKEEVLNFISGNQGSLRKIYERVHHTEKEEGVTNNETEKLTDEKIIYYGKLLKAIKQK